MTDYREILRLHSLGHSIHGIALGVPCARNTASRIHIQSIDPKKDQSMREVYGLDKRLRE